jgi:hypothetical protein
LLRGKCEPRLYLRDLTELDLEFLHLSDACRSLKSFSISASM